MPVSQVVSIEKYPFDRSPVQYFPDLKVRVTRCVGMSNYMSDKKRETFDPPFVIAKAEPRNKVDPNAVKIMEFEGKKIGYLPAGIAKNYSEILKEIGELRLDCRTVGTKLWMDLPHLTELRKRVQGPNK